jgi:streptomycin 6-kinase
VEGEGKDEADTRDCVATVLLRHNPKREFFPNLLPLPTRTQDRAAFGARIPK